MYNEETKLEYIKVAEQTSTEARGYLTRIFGRSEEMEVKLGKDLCDWNGIDIITFYKLQLYTSFSTIKILNTMLTNYTEWCLRHNLVADSQNHFEELSTNTLISCVNTALSKMGIFTREELLSEIESFYNVGDKFIVLGLFEGLMGNGMSDFWDITADNIDGNKITLKGSGRVLEVSDQLIQYAYDSINEYFFHPFLKSDTGVIQKDKKFDFDDRRVIKAMWNTTKESDTILRRRIMNRLARLTRADKTPYRRALLMESGRIDMLKRYMKEDGTTDIRTAYNQHKKNLEYRYGVIYDLGAWITQYSQYFEET